MSGTHIGPAATRHRVLAFEPMSDNVQLLRHSLCLNPGLDERLELHEVALSENADCLLGSNSQNAGPFPRTCCTIRGTDILVGSVRIRYAACSADVGSGRVG
eukprot:3122474-Rhodomonas_salina.2